MTVGDYLGLHYWNEQKLAEQCKLTVFALENMVADGLIPRPSYTVSGNVLVSAAFGELEAQDAPEGSYFHPATVSWINRAQEMESTNDSSALRQLFHNNMAAALADLDRDTWRLSDAFDDRGQPIVEELNRRIDSNWKSFQDGIFGLCVANPVSEREIARKEILQEKLSALTANGEHAGGLAISKNGLRQLIDAYEEASMPFSPVEYPISSRKRLIDDLRKKLAA
jgi:hypothetical protein